MTQTTHAPMPAPIGGWIRDTMNNIHFCNWQADIMHRTYRLSRALHYMDLAAQYQRTLQRLYDQENQIMEGVI